MQQTGSSSLRNKEHLSSQQDLVREVKEQSNEDPKSSDGMHFTLGKEALPQF